MFFEKWIRFEEQNRKNEVEQLRRKKLLLGEKNNNLRHRMIDRLWSNFSAIIYIAVMFVLNIPNLQRVKLDYFMFHFMLYL